MCLAGFAIRGRELVVYIYPEGREDKALLSKLGKHKMGKSCLYFKRLADLDKKILEQLVASSVLKVTRRYGTTSGAKPPLEPNPPRQAGASARTLDR
jgi:hypothetical protein